MGRPAGVQLAGFSPQTARPVAAVVGPPTQRAAASHCAERPFFSAGSARPVAQFSLPDIEAGLWAAGSRLAAALWLPGAGGRNVCRSTTFSRHLLQGRGLASLGTHPGV